MKFIFFLESPFYKHLEKWTEEISSQIIILTILNLNVSLSQSQYFLKIQKWCLLDSQGFFIFYPKASDMAYFKYM